MVRCSLSRRVPHVVSSLVTLAFIVGASVVSGSVVSCSGTAVLDAGDSLACETGHDCGSTICRCEDDTVLLSSLCEKEECKTSDEVCARRCQDADHGSSLTSVDITSEESPLAAPFCETICARLQIGGCESGCDPFFTGCEAEVVCDPELEALYACLANEAVLSCEDGAVAFSGCAAPPGLCTVAP